MDIINKDSRIIFIIGNDTHFMSAISLLRVLPLENITNIFVLINKQNIRNYEGITNFLLNNNIKFSPYEFNLKKFPFIKKFIIKNLFQLLKFFSIKLAFHYFWKIPLSFLDSKFEIMCSYPSTSEFNKFIGYYRPKVFFELYDGLSSLRLNYNYPVYIEKVFLVKHNYHWVQESINNDIYVKSIYENGNLQNLYHIFKISEVNIKNFLQENFIGRDDTIVIFTDQWNYPGHKNLKVERFLKDMLFWIHNQKDGIKFFLKEHPRDNMKVEDKYPFMPKYSLSLSHYFKFSPIELILYSLKDYSNYKLKLVLISAYSSANFVLEDIGLIDGSLVSIINTELIINTNVINFIQDLQSKYHKIKFLNKFDSIIREIKE